MRQNVSMRTHLQARPMKKGKSASLLRAELLLRVSRASKMIGQIFLLLLVCIAAQAQRKMEHLNRGVVAMRTSDSQVYVGWRMLGTDPAGIAFNVYRGTTKLNDTPITTTTNYIDTNSSNESYHVRPVINGVEQKASETASVTSTPYLNVPLQIPPGGTTPSGEAYTYTANDASVGDLDGDGEYDIVLKWEPSNAKDNSQGGYTGNVFIDGYKLNGTRLWRIDLGKNVRAGAHYTQVMVYDLDGDGRAEVACRTSDGTIDGTGVLIGNGYADYRTVNGYVLEGPEYLTVFNGQNGKAMATTDYIPERGAVSSWGDGYGNRVDRFVAGVAYLDGKHPSLVMGRGYYTRLVRVAWDWRNGKLTHRWTFDSNTPGNEAYAGQGNHQVTVGDMDGDGKDDFNNGSSTIKSDGTGLWNNKLGHGDALHMSDMDPDRPGLEIWMPHEHPAGNGGVGAALLDGKTGVPIWTRPIVDADIGRGMAADIDPAHKGYEVWAAGATGGVFNSKGVQISTARPSINFAVWWDADLSRELLDGTKIDKWNPATSSSNRLLTANECTSNNSTKATPALSGDILGDWREEVIWRTIDNKALHIYTTTIPATNRMYTLMHDPQYRLAIAWQNTAYNQPPHPGFYLGTDMAAPPQPNIELVSAKGIGDGNYLIKPVHSGLCLSASDTLQQQNCDTTGVQVWQVSKQGDNGYQIYSLGAKKYVGYEQAASGAKVILTNDPSPALFRVIEADSGAFYIAPTADSSLVLEIAGGSAAAGQSLQLVASSTNGNQKFTFEALGNYTDCNGDWRGTAYRDSCNTCVGGNTGVQACTTTLTSGIYTFKTGSSFCVQAGDSITQQVCDTLDTQVWQITKVSGIYDIYSLPLKKYVSYTSAANGSLLTLSDTKKQYRLEKAANGSFYLSPIDNPKVVFNVLGDTSSTGQPIQLGARNGSASQQYRFEKNTRNIDCNGVWRGTAKIDNCGTCTGGNTGIQACNTSLVEGIYVIKPVNSGLCLTPGPGTTFSQQACTGTETNGQLWRLTKVGGLYAISSLSTGKYLGYSQAAIVASLSLVDSSARKLFRMETAPSGSLYVYPSENLKVRWDVANRLTTPGATVGLYNNGTSTNQRFYFQIVPQQASVSLSVDSNRVYNGQPSVATATTVPANLPVKITYNGSATAPSAAGTYAVVAIITHPAYKGTATDTLTIAKGLLTVSASDTSRTYGAENPDFSLVYSGFVNGESASVLDSLPRASSMATTTSNVGTYAITVTGGVDSNYAFAYQPGSLSIEKAILTAKADTKSRAFAEPNPALTISYSGFVNSEEASVLDQLPVATTTATLNSPNGTYPITVSGGTDANYSFNYQSDLLTVYGQPTLKAQYRVKDGYQPNDKHIRPQFQLVNTGTVAVPYQALTIRYWYTKEGNANQAFWCDYATLGTSKVKGSFVAIPAVSEANQYVEVSFTSTSLLAAGRNSGEIQTRFNKEDWSVYNEVGDYSYSPSKTQFSDWNRVAVYYKGVLVWGVEPTSATTARIDLEGKVTNQVSISPNPSNTSFSIKTLGSFSYQIYDQQGNVVEEGQGKNNVAVGKSLKAGLYVVNVFTATHYKAIKVIKQ